MPWHQVVDEGWALVEGKGRGGAASLTKEMATSCFAPSSDFVEEYGDGDHKGFRKVNLALIRKGLEGAILSCRSVTEASSCLGAVLLSPRSFQVVTTIIGYAWAWPGTGERGRSQSPNRLMHLQPTPC